MRVVHLAVLMLAVAAAPARADRPFAVYEGADAVRTGTGGTKITKNGVDFWTSGSPPRRYRILGTATHNRNRGWDKRIPDSASFAREVIKHGGDAAIIPVETEKKEWGFGQSTETKEVTIIKYLE